MQTNDTDDDYTGLGARAWDLYSGDEPEADHAFFRTLIEQGNGPALDVGCGTGRLLLPYLQAGLDVDGVEPSADMLALCRQRADERGLNPALYPQTLQTLDLPRRYRTIIVPCGTIQLVQSRADVRESLRRLHAHLEPGGRLVLTASNPWLWLPHIIGERKPAEPGDEWGHRATKPLPDGTRLAKHARLDGHDLVEQTLAVTIRYRRLASETDDVLEEQLCNTPNRWYFPHELSLLVELAGFLVERVTGNYSPDEPFNNSHSVMALCGQRSEIA